MKSVRERIESKKFDWECRLTKSNDAVNSRVIYVNITLQEDVLKSMKSSRRSCLNKIMIAFFLFVLFLGACFALEYTLPKGDMAWFSNIIQAIFKKRIDP